MAKQVQLRRGTTAELSSVTGAVGEVIVDTTKDTLTVHDAYTAGGVPLLRENLGNLGNNTIGLGKIATGTHGQVLYYNASGQLTALNPGTSGNVLQTNGSGQNPSWASNKFVGVRYYTNSTRTSLPDSGNYTFWSITDTKILDASTIAVIAFLPGHTNYSGSCGTFISYDGTRQWSVSYTYEANAHSKQMSGAAAWTGKFAGSRTLAFGWQTNDGSTSNRPFAVWNPNTSDDIRQPQTTSYAIVYEYLP